MVKGVYLSKALTCMQFFLYKQNLLFYQGDGYLWPQCCELLKSCMLGRKVIYVRCINCSYNNVAKGIRLLDKKAFFVYTGKKIMQVRAFERYIPLMK